MNPPDAWIPPIKIAVGMGENFNGKIKNIKKLRNNANDISK